eukprot:3529172-Rhodomonas_salina.2
MMIQIRIHSQIHVYNEQSYMSCQAALAAPRGCDDRSNDTHVYPGTGYRDRNCNCEIYLVTAYEL